MTEPNKPHEPMSAQERLDLGRSYYNEGKFDEAIAVLKTISTSENPAIYAMSQGLLGSIYMMGLGRLDKAITAWSNIRRNDNPEAYAQAQLGLGAIYKSQDKLDKATTAWSNITHQDNPETYTQAQFNLGNAYQDQGKLDEAITAWSNIRRNDNPETYAGAQLNLGNAYCVQNKLDEAITTWSNIRHDDNRKAYTWAQDSLGDAYYVQNKLDEAVTAWSNIRRSDDPETYARAQLNLGLAYNEAGKLDQAITTWSKITRDDDPETYARAQLNLGTAYASQDNLDDAITAWSSTRRDDDPEIHARAQHNLGTAYASQEKTGKAITIWSHITRDDDPKAYTWAQHNLGVAYKDQDELDQAITIWSRITRDDAPDAYIEAQLYLGEVYSLDKEKEEQAHEAYNNVREFFYYKSERGFKILKCPVEVRKNLHTVAENTDEVLKYLQIIPGFESKVAHYTRPQIAFDLFEDKKNNKKPSNFRLSTIRGVNDPTEGLVLGNYWTKQGIPETIHTNDTATFISCFTFNHDNLNQFRLYGKENGREATGVSLVFNKEFFSNQADTSGFIAAPSTDLSSKSEQIKLNETGKMENDNKKPLIGKSTLYRCIYLDPETGYWTLAQRDKSTFYREHNEDEDADAKEKWEKYYKLISKKEECVEKYLFSKKDNNNKSVSSMLKLIFAGGHSYNKYNKEEKQYILEAIRFILLPLQYLVKHIAFQEEQECRIMYITQFRDEKIHSDREKQWMYVEYEEPVLPHIDKIWLSPGAAKYQDHFRILLDQDGNKSKVRISQNPFRNKE